MADAPGLGSGAARREGSSPFSCTGWFGELRATLNRAGRFACGSLASLGTALVGCGGIVVFDEGAGGAGGAAASASTSVAGPSASGVTSSVTGLPACEDLQLELERANLAARECFPEKPAVQCTGREILLDTCGCPSLVANEWLTEEIDAAREAYEAWVAAGCGPWDCGQCTRAMGGACLKGPNGQGLCEGLTTF